MEGGSYIFNIKATWGVTLENDVTLKTALLEEEC